ncbi:MAG: FMN-binding negative transcriptional regulator, partial [Planctomycetaceae bacterium]|nr:FMN-binding negative transcriptional regulator [Planctomycetaceae bacterium]
MYLPETFVERDAAVLARVIREESFATLISQHAGAPFASHVPLLLEEGTRSAEGELRGRLIGHVARANPQWKSADGETVLAIFHGPHAYVSPTCYGQGDAVPTWNYIAVHVSGKLTIIEDRERLREIVARTVEYFEATREPRWSLEQASEEFIEKLLGGIVGFEIEIERVEGKFKLSQNQTEQRRA